MASPTDLTTKQPQESQESWNFHTFDTSSLNAPYIAPAKLQASNLPFAGQSCDQKIFQTEKTARYEPSKSYQISVQNHLNCSSDDLCLYLRIRCRSRGWTATKKSSRAPRRLQFRTCLPRSRPCRNTLILMWPNVWVSGWREEIPWCVRHTVLLVSITKLR